MYWVIGITILVAAWTVFMYRLTIGKAKKQRQATRDFLDLSEAERIVREWRSPEEKAIAAALKAEEFTQWKADYVKQCRELGIPTTLNADGEVEQSIAQDAIFANVKSMQAAQKSYEIRSFQGGVIKKVEEEA